MAPRRRTVNRPAQMRANNRRLNTFNPNQRPNSMPNRSELPGVQTPGDVPVIDSSKGRMGACPPGMTRGKDPMTGASTCVSKNTAGVKPPVAGSPNNKNNQGY